MAVSYKNDPWFNECLMKGAAQRLGELSEEFEKTSEFEKFSDVRQRLHSRLENALPEESRGILKEYDSAMNDLETCREYFFYTTAMSDCLVRILEIGDENKKGSHVETFEDGSCCIVAGKVRQFRMGNALVFIDRISMSDGIVYENMQCDITAAVPTPGGLAKLFEQFGAQCCYDTVSDNHTGRGKRKRTG